MSNQELKEAVETILFTTSRALPPRKIVELSGDLFSSKEVRDTVKQLNSEYKKTRRVFRIEQVGDGFQLRTLSEFSKWVRKLETTKTIKLSMATMETLSIIAYKQPVTRAGIEFIRGVDSSHTIRRLVKQKLIRIIGRELVPGRPSLYGTTKNFLEVFGLTHLKHLPALAELKQEDTAKNRQLEIPLVSSDQEAELEPSEPPLGFESLEKQPDKEKIKPEESKENVI